MLKLFADKNVPHGEKMKNYSSQYLLCLNRSFALKPVYRILIAALAVNLCFVGLTQQTVVNGQATVTDTKAIRTEAGQWLKLARQAMQESNYALATDYVIKAERLNPQYDALTVRFEDTPQKVRAAIQAAAAPKTPQVTIGDSPQANQSAAVPTLNAQQAKSQAVAALNQARNAMQANDVNAALSWYHHAASFGAPFANNEYGPNQLAAELQQAGVPPNQLMLRPRTAVANVAAASAKQQVLQLLSISQAAIDRGDFATAQQSLARAEGLQVPDSAFVGNELRIWQVQLRLDKMTPSVAARTVSGQPGVGVIRPSIYNPTQNPSQVTFASGPTSAQFGGNENVSAQARGLYQEGITALRAQDRALALAKFQEAWKYEANVDPVLRRDLQEKIRLISADVSRNSGALEVTNPLNQIDATQQLLRQKLFSEIMAGQKIAEEMTTDDPRSAMENLLAMRNKVESSTLDRANKGRLLAIVDRSVTSLEQYLTENLSDIELDEKNQATRARVKQGQADVQETRDEISILVDDFNSLLDERRYAEAEVVAKKAKAIAPEDAVVQNMIWKSKFIRRHADQQAFGDLYEQATFDALEDVDRSKLPMDTRLPLRFDAKNWESLTASRRKLLERTGSNLSPAGLKIQQALAQPVDVNFNNAPLSVVIDTLARMTGVNVHVDAQGIGAEGVTSDTPVSITLSQPVSLRSALALILDELRLSYVIRNEVLLITSEQARDLEVYQNVYNVADLVIGIPNFVPGFNVGLPAAIRAANQNYGMTSSSAKMPMNFASANLTGAVSQNSSVLGQMPLDGLMPGASSLGNNPTMSAGGQGGAAQADFDTLINLIKSTIEPLSWDDQGGSGTIQPFPGNLSLVVSATQQVHEEIRDLLEQLRKSQDLQVTIEVRMITLTDNFFERIGIDFDFEIDDNVDPNLIQDDGGPSAMFGLDSQGPTIDLDLVFDQNDAYASAIPQFGAYDAGTAAQFGFAILSDIEVFFLLEAAQGDTRSNVLTAPKVTLFNGQTASVSDLSQRPFVTGLTPVVGDFAVAHQPIIVVLGEGTTMSVQAVVSEDRRFVRLTLVPFFSRIGNVEEFTFDGETTTSSGETVLDADGNPVNRNNQVQTSRGTTVQLPTFNFTSVSTTVSVPDGGTVLLGGIKRLAEGRSERGVPMLAQLPYISRLFKNVGIGRDTESLMMMVTPRIIIQEEEEKRQTGITADDL
jgi:general secretion pathway protein D